MNRSKLSLLLAPLVLLSGCSFGASIDTLMAPPKLSIEQEEIYNALTLSTGSAISLKYPKSGKYLSAFIVEDIDGGGDKEAVVFYERNVHSLDENPLRISTFAKDTENSWVPVSDKPAMGSEIEKVMISKLGDNARTNLIIGSSSINRAEKIVSVYTVSGGQLMDPDFSLAYNYFDVVDMDNDGQNEFVMISTPGAGAPASVIAYKLDSEGKYHESVCELNGSFSESDSRISYGRLSTGETAMYIDASSGSGTVQTEIIYMDKKGAMKKMFPAPEEAMATERPIGFNTFDIDYDGMLEIPCQEICPGYEQSPESEQVMLTNWMGLGKDNRLERKYTSYYSTSDGFVFIFPEKWRKKVTVRRDTISNELAFNVITDGKRGRELMRICHAEDIASREDRLSTGYMLLHTKGDSSFLAYIPQSGSHADGLSISSADVAVGFRFRD